MEIFDIHHHLGSLPGGSLQEEPGWQDKDYANRVRIMDANGVTRAAILAATGYIQADGLKDTRRSNDVVAACQKRDLKRFPVACGIDIYGSVSFTFDVSGRSLAEDVKLASLHLSRFVRCARV